MKKLLLFLVLTNLGFGQVGIVEIRLLNENIGIPAFNYSTNNTTESNDAGINLILQTHNVFEYITKGGHFYPPFANKYIEIWCDNSDASQLASDLLAYSNVVEKVRVTTYESPFDNSLLLQISNTTTGTPSGIIDGIIVTNDVGLNQIFQDYNVYYYIQSFPYASTNNLLRYYNLVCNCDNELLKIALDNYNTVISATEYNTPTYLLNTNSFIKNKTTISPNPFSTNFEIQSNETISSYSLFDITGKQLTTTASKNELYTISSQLNSGIYFLSLDFENGQQATYKLIKN